MSLFNHVPINFQQAELIEKDDGHYYQTPKGDIFPSITTILQKTMSAEKQQSLQNWQEQEMEGCSLTTISLNQCSTIGTSEPTFSIGVERITTESGAMIVRPEKNALVVRQSAADIGGEASVWFRFEFDPPFQTKTTKFPTGFSGGYAKHSSLLGKIVTGKFVPFEGLMSVVSLDCPLLVPGLRSLPSSLQNQVAE